MSASDKKKLRKEQASAALTDKQQAQKKEDKQLKTYTTVFAVVMALVVLFAAVSLGLNWYENSGAAARNTVAITIGSSELSNADLNYYFIDTVNSFYSDLYDSYSSYANLYAYYLYGLDLTTSLDLQVYNESTGDTWADYFLDSAITSAKATYALYEKALEAGFELDEVYQAELDYALSYARANASYYGYTSFEDYLKAYYGSGADVESFTNYYTVNCYADAYYASYAETLTYTDDEINAYNEENYDNFSTFDYSYYYVNVSDYLPEKSTEDSTDETTSDEEVTYTEAEQEAARAAAEADANSLAEYDSAMMIEKNYGKLTGNPTNFKNYTSTVISSVSSLYSDWIKDRTRQVGDTTVIASETTTTDDDGNKVTTVNGYYVVLFEGRDDYLENMINIRHILVAFEGGTEETDDDGNTTTVYSDEEKQAAYDKAKALYDQWLAGDADEASFAALATSENSDDSGSNTNGGLYENVFNGYMTETFNDWCFAEDRQVGDHGIIETEYGYHIMYFSAHVEQSYREYCIVYALRSADASEWYEALIADTTAVEGNTNYIDKNLVIASSSST